MKQKIAELLLQSKAIKLEPTKPFTWASGWKSPIYCDNRITLSYPEIRSEITNAYLTVINENFMDVEAIAGVATGAIAQGALVAEKLGLPFVYVRSVPKSHGTKNQIEGETAENQRIVVIEDLVSTGGSSLKAVMALRDAGVNVLGMVATFTYGFPVAEENFSKHHCSLHTLSDYHALLKLSLETGFIEKSQLDLLKAWRESPERWIYKK